MSLVLVRGGQQVIKAPASLRPVHRPGSVRHGDEPGHMPGRCARKQASTRQQLQSVQQTRNGKAMDRRLRSHQIDVGTGYEMLSIVFMFYGASPG